MHASDTNQITVELLNFNRAADKLAQIIWHHLSIWISLARIWCHTPRTKMQFYKVLCMKMRRKDFCSQKINNQQIYIISTRAASIFFLYFFTCKIILLNISKYLSTYFSRKCSLLIHGYTARKKCIINLKKFLQYIKLYRNVILLYVTCKTGLARAPLVPTSYFSSYSS